MESSGRNLVGDSTGSIFISWLVPEEEMSLDNNDDNQTPKDEVNMFVCDVCGKTFSSKKKLRNHKEVHSQAISECRDPPLQFLQHMKLVLKCIY